MKQQHSSTHNLERETIEITVKSVPHMEEDKAPTDSAKTEEKKTDNPTNATRTHNTQAQNMEADKTTKHLQNPATDQPPKQSSTNDNTAKAQKADKTEQKENNTPKMKQQQNRQEPTVFIGRSTILVASRPLMRLLLKDLTDDEEDTNHDNEEPDHNGNNGV